MFCVRYLEIYVELCYLTKLRKWQIQLLFQYHENCNYYLLYYNMLNAYSLLNVHSGICVRIVMVCNVCPYHSHSSSSFCVCRWF